MSQEKLAVKIGLESPFIATLENPSSADIPDLITVIKALQFFELPFRIQK